VLTHAFEKWRALRVCLHTDARNERSAHRLAADRTARDSMRFSILADEWPAVQRRLNQLSLRG
jgi:RimJ/RimL family protein N-acetyltransferase